MNAEKGFWLFFTIFGSVFVVLGFVIGIVVGTASRDFMFSIMFTSIFSGVGALFAAIGAIPLSKIIKKEKLNKWLIENGRVIWATITHTDVDLSMNFNGRHPYIIYAEYEDESIVTTLYRFKSERAFIKYEDATPGSLIKIYVDHKDMSKHFVDIESIKQNMTTNVVDFT